MPMTYQIDKDRKIAFLKASGKFTNEEMIACTARLNADPDLMEGMPTLTDTRSVTEMGVTADGFKALIKLMETSRKPRGTSPAAILVSEKSNAMVGKLLVAFSELDPCMPRYKVFVDQAEAESWLGLSPEREWAKIH